jgi:putative ABC transport system substrate-binding protein
MRRREFITLLGGAAVPWPLVALAQQPDRMRRIGVLFGGFAANDPEPRARMAAFQQALGQLGWADGRNLRIDLRIGGGDAERVQAHAVDLIGMRPDVIAVNSAPALAALQRETRAIPIVFVSVADPVAAGFVASLAHPGGMITGFTNFEASLGSKWLELLKQIAPGITRAAVIQDAASPVAGEFLKVIEAAAPPLGIQFTSTFVRNAAEIERIITEGSRATGRGLIFPGGTIVAANRASIIELAARHRLPAIYGFGYYPRMGGLISYGVDGVDLWRRAAPYVDRILRGSNPSDLPVQQPTKFELVINLKTAKALGLDVPLHLQQLADEVIE